MVTNIIVFNFTYYFPTIACLLIQNFQTRNPTITPVISAVSPASANNMMFPVSEKKSPELEEDPLPESPEEDATVVAVTDKTVMTTVAVSVSAGVPPSVAVAVRVYLVPAVAADRST